MKDKFNKYCAKVMGYAIAPNHLQVDDYGIVLGKDPDYFVRDFYDDMNDMSEVVEKLITPEREYFVEGNLTACFMKMKRHQIGIKQAFRDFIISTMGDSE